ncbi:uncharacterized protein SETTUDRAFT_26816 [Exserohilum turcica Et28A]|uniref:Uncharacterized protein n=1 Tax=Exserohilum turcicum (strain 28A) TaxID=671987 RepID=R0IVY0_EXST2|nr:uncharacterized protein SETTUDRAFT_26816 [Exserohilum turcica Et28A]EOA88766.1 hypothetical protein SETTUDRAFT_26816 [Exserohilum turcica Et28A]
MLTLETSESAPPGEVSENPLIAGVANDGVVLVGIGPQAQQYHLHSAPITHPSEYFHKAFNGIWRE